MMIKQVKDMKNFIKNYLIQILLLISYFFGGIYFIFFLKNIDEFTIKMIGALFLILCFKQMIEISNKISLDKIEELINDLNKIINEKNEHK
jgi:hypothetical protein